MMIRFFSLAVFLLFINLSIGECAKPFFTPDFEIAHNQITKNGKVLAKLVIENKEVKYTEKVKAKEYTVKIYNRKDKLVALYDVKANTKAGKKNESGIYEASIVTYKDNVTHNGANFVDYHSAEAKKDSAPQLEKAVDYLLSNNYL